MSELYGVSFWYWRGLGLAGVLLFFSVTGLLLLCLRQRRRGLTAAAIPMVLLHYLLMQTMLSVETLDTRGAAPRLLFELLLLPPRWALAVFVLFLCVIHVLFWWLLLRYEHSHVTPMTVKEALDDLPMGVCAWLEGGQVVLVNHVMETLCRAAVGQPARNGVLLRRRLEQGELPPGCRCQAVGEGLLLHLPENKVFSLSFQELPFEGQVLTLLLASDVSEVWQKTLELERGRQELSDLSRRLDAYNREIVELTAREEILNARIRIHDRIGADLLVLRKLLSHKGSPAEAEEVQSRLRRNILFLKSEEQADVTDELEIMLQTARDLGVRVEIRGGIPQNETVRHVLATGIHECFTNVLRHAHGDRLLLELRENADAVHAVFTGSGESAQGEIREKGGLLILRDMTERCGGTMTVAARPVFTVCLSLPKEAAHG